MSKQRTPKHYGNSECLTKGHEWCGTAACNFRVCARMNCRAMERLEGSIWTDATPTSTQLRRHHPLVSATLWDEQTLLREGLHPKQREIERHVERHYLQSLRVR